MSSLPEFGAVVLLTEVPGVFRLTLDECQPNASLGAEQ